jgi:hypothetical protein
MKKPLILLINLASFGKNTPFCDARASRSSGFVFALLSSQAIPRQTHQEYRLEKP